MSHSEVCHEQSLYLFRQNVRELENYFLCGTQNTMNILRYKRAVRTTVNKCMWLYYVMITRSCPVKYTIGNKFQCNLNRKLNLQSQKPIFRYCLQIAAIASRPKCVNDKITNQDIHFRFCWSYCTLSFVYENLLKKTPQKQRRTKSPNNLLKWNHRGCSRCVIPVSGTSQWLKSTIQSWCMRGISEPGGVTFCGREQQQRIGEHVVLALSCKSANIQRRSHKKTDINV